MSNKLQKTDYELSSIATVLKDNSLVDDLIENMSIDHYTDKTAKKAFEWIKSQYMKNKSYSLPKMKTETEIDVSKIIDNEVILKDYSDVLEILDKYKTRRNIYKALTEINEVVQQEDLEVEQYQNKAQEIIFDVTANRKNSEGIYHIEDSLKELHERITKVQNGEEKFKGISTGYPSIDNNSGGLQKTHLTVVAAPTSMGKTAFALSLTYNIIKTGKKAIFISLEMEHTELTERLVSIDSKVPVSAYKDKLAEYQLQNTNVAFSDLMETNLYISDKRGLSTADIKARCRKIANKMGDVDFIVVDYLQNIKLERTNENTAKRVGNAVKDLRNLSHELGCNLLLVSQMHRKRSGKPNMSNMRDSGEIEETADEVYIPYRPSYDEEDNQSNEKELVQLIKAKGRTSKTDVMNFYWYPSILYWRDAYEEDMSEPLQIND